MPDEKAPNNALDPKIIHFDNCRQQVERCVEKLDLTDQWASTLHWMRKVVEQKTAEPNEASR
ncbi:MAG: hypothetical protein ACXAB4_05430 [Candidatus Hodarchaeales archaeon]|jgi:hypothetical protein